MKEDELRGKILDILTDDSRTPPERIARMLGEDREKVDCCIQELESKGILRSYTATVDWERAGVDKITAFVDVSMVPAREVGFDAVAMRIARFPEVKSAWLVSGGSDLRVLVEADHLRDLANFVAEKLAAIDGVTGTNTHFLLRKYKEEFVLFGEPETDERLVISP